MNAQKRHAIFARLRAANPHPTSELEYKTPFELLVAVVLSAQATDKGVNKATAKLFPVARTPAAIVKLGVDGLIPYVQSIGLFRNKAKNIVALSEILLREHGGEVPADREALERLPGVGRKTANVVLNTAFGQPTIAVDTHIFRVANRTGPRAGQERRRGRAQADEIRARGIQAGRAPLADPARPLRLRRALAEMRRMHHSRSLRVPRQDAVAPCSRHRATTRAAFSPAPGPSTAQAHRSAGSRAWRPESSRFTPSTTRSSKIRTAISIATTVPKTATSTRSCICRCISRSPSSSASTSRTDIRAHFERLTVAKGDEHAALHAVLDCLGEVMWHAQRHGTPPDAAIYLACLEQQR